MKKSWKEKLSEYRAVETEKEPEPIEQKRAGTTSPEDRLKRIRSILRRMEESLERIDADADQQPILRRALADIDASLGPLKKSGRR